MLRIKVFFDTVDYSFIDILVDIVFVADLILTFLTAYRDEHNALVKDRWRIARRYLRSWFIFDLISSFPYYLLESSGEIVFTGRWARIGSLFRSVIICRCSYFVRLLRLLKILKAYKYKQLFETLEYNPTIPSDVLRLFKLLVTVVSVTHIRYDISDYFV